MSISSAACQTHDPKKSSSSRADSARAQSGERSFTNSLVKVAGKSLIGYPAIISPPFTVGPIIKAELDNQDFPNFDVLMGVVPTEAALNTADDPESEGDDPSVPKIRAMTIAPTFIYVVGHHGRADTVDISVYAEGTTFAIWSNPGGSYTVFHYAHDHKRTDGQHDKVRVTLKQPVDPANPEVFFNEAGYVEIQPDGIRSKFATSQPIKMTETPGAGKAWTFAKADGTPLPAEIDKQISTIERERFDLRMAIGKKP